MSLTRVALVLAFVAQGCALDPSGLHGQGPADGSFDAGPRRDAGDGVDAGQIGRAHV
jgi:hypothetical protein